MLLIDKSRETRTSEKPSEGRRLHFYEKGEDIPLASQGVWQVYRGFAQLSQVSCQGEEILLGWMQPLNFFGIWLTDTESYQAKALSEIYLKWYDISELETSPHLAQLMLTQVVRRMRQTEALLAIAGRRRVEERLQALLQLLKQELGEPLAGGTRLPVRLTHQNIANTIGTTRVTVTRLLGELQRQEAIQLDSDRHIIILD
jgi:CRP-like cAMP-binding protein